MPKIPPPQNFPHPRISPIPKFPPPQNFPTQKFPLLKIPLTTSDTHVTQTWYRCDTHVSDTWHARVTHAIWMWPARDTLVTHAWHAFDACIHTRTQDTHTHTHTHVTCRWHTRDTCMTHSDTLVVCNSISLHHLPASLAICLPSRHTEVLYKCNTVMTRTWHRRDTHVAQTSHAVGTDVTRTWHRRHTHVTQTSHAGGTYAIRAWHTCDLDVVDCLYLRLPVTW